MKTRSATFLISIALLACLTFSQGQQKYEVECMKDVSYGPHERNKLDIYWPHKKPGLSPAVLLVHGGAWRAGSKKSKEIMACDLVSRGFVVVACNYRFAPQDPHPAQLDDVQRVVRWMRANTEEYKTDPDRIGATGDSAGGHLVAMLGSRDTRAKQGDELDRFSSKVQAVVPYYGPTDLRVLSAASVVQELVGKKIEDSPPAWSDASPITFVSGKASPYLFIHGDQDPLVPLAQSRDMCEALKKAGVEAGLLVIEGGVHGFGPIDQGNGKRAWDATVAFLTKKLSK